MRLLLFCLCVLAVPYAISFMAVNNNRLHSRMLNKLASAKGKPEKDDLTSNFRLSDEERLQKVISRAGLASRRAAERLILDGRVSVNGKMVTELGLKVNAKKDQVMVDGKRVKMPDAKEIYWILLNKPKSTITTVADEKDRENVLNLIPRGQELRLLPVGRMERDATGLMLLTNENGWIHPLTHPSFRIRKRYEMVLDGIPTQKQLDELLQGLHLKGETMPVKLNSISIKDSDLKQKISLVDVTVEESLPMQLQRMFEYIDCPLTSLKRLEFGPVKLKGVSRGKWRELSISEIQKLKDAVRSAPRTPDEEKKKIAGERKGQSKRPGAGYFRRTIAGTDADEERNQRYNGDRQGPRYNGDRQGQTSNTRRGGSASSRGRGTDTERSSNRSWDRNSSSGRPQQSRRPRVP